MKAFHQNESNVKKTWGIINELTSRKQNESHIKEIKLNGSLVSDPPGLSETFNSYFAGVGPKLIQKIPCDENNCPYLEYLNRHNNNSNSFELKPTTSSIVCSLLVKLQKLQNRAARVLTFSSYDANADALIEKLGWKKLSFQRQFQKAVMVYKSLNGLAPEYMHSMFVDRDSVNPYSLRNTESKLAVPKPRTNYLKTGCAKLF